MITEKDVYCDRCKAEHVPPICPVSPEVKKQEERRQRLVVEAQSLLDTLNRYGKGVKVREAEIITEAFDLERGHNVSNADIAPNMKASGLLKRLSEEGLIQRHESLERKGNAP